MWIDWGGSMITEAARIREFAADTELIDEICAEGERCSEKLK